MRRGPRRCGNEWERGIRPFGSKTGNGVMVGKGPVEGRWSIGSESVEEGSSEETKEVRLNPRR